MRIAAALLLAIAIGAPAQDAAQISGRVVDDRNQPVGGASVYLIGGPLPGARTTITREDGRFTLSAVPPATYTMTIAKNAFPTIRYGQTRPDGPGAPIQVSAGRSMSLEIRLPRGAVIAGRVIDDGGDPVARRQIVLSRPSAPASPSVKGLYPSTNSRGQYRIIGLPAGTYAVGAATPQLSGFSGPAADNVMVTVAAGDEREGIDLRASPEGRTTYVTLRSLSADGQPLRLTEVRLRRAGASWGTVSQATRNPDGSSTIAAVPAGQYTVLVQSGPYRGSTDILVDGDHPVAVGVTLTRGVSIRGRVVFDGGSKQPGPFTLYLADADGNDFPSDGFRPSGLVGWDGAFAIEGGPHGRFLVRATESRDTDPWTVQSATVRDMDAAGIPLAVGRYVDAADIPLAIGGDDIAGVTVTMTDAKSRVRGRVSGAGGRAVNGIDVIVFPADPRFRTRKSRRVATAQTTVDGDYEIAGLPPGDYALALVDDLDRDALNDPAVLQKLPPVSSFTLVRGETREQNVTIK